MNRMLREQRQTLESVVTFFVLERTMEEGALEHAYEMNTLVMKVDNAIW